MCDYNNNKNMNIPVISGSISSKVLNIGNDINNKKNISKSFGEAIDNNDDIKLIDRKNDDKDKNDDKESPNDI